MAKIAFKNPKGGTIYLAKVGFDWGGFWGFFILGGLPFFLRKMYALGFFCLAYDLVLALQRIGSSLEAEGDSTQYDWVGLVLIAFFFSLYFGIRGGRLTARHYMEEGYSLETKDKKLLALAKRKWKLEE